MAAPTPMLQLGLISCKVRAIPAADKPTSNANICTGAGLHPQLNHPQRPAQRYHAIQRTRQGSLKCPSCGTPPNGKAREISEGVLVEIPAEELAAMAEAATAHKRVIDLRVHPADQVTEMLPAPEGKVYVLTPYDAVAAANYALLLDQVRKHVELCFTTVWAVSTVAARYRLVEFRDRIALVELARPEALRELAPIPETVPNPGLAAMADQFLTTMVTPYDPNDYRDSARERLESVIAASTPVVGGGPATPVPTSDLMAALSAAVTAAGATPIESAPSKARKPRARKSA